MCYVLNKMILYMINNIFDISNCLLFKSIYQMGKFVMKKYILFLLSGIIICSLIGCINFATSNNSPINNNDNFIISKLEEKDTQLEKDNSNMKTEEKTMNILIGNKKFTATLDNSKTVDELLEILPMDISMSELNGNEKYYYLPINLTTNIYKPEEIRKGDIMLYGNNCLVIFYKTFPNSYNYTYIGHIDDVTDLTETIGLSDVKVKIE